MSIGFVAAFLLVQSMPGPAAGQWEPVGTQPGGVSFAIDAASLARTGDTVTVRVRVTREQTGEDGVKTVILRYAIDCAARETTTEAADLYGTNGAYMSSPPTDDMTGPVGNDAGAQALFNRACRPAAPAAPAGH